MSTAWSDDHFIGGDIALDLANTVYRRTPELGADLLDDVDDLVSWLRHAELPSPGSGRLDGSDLREARLLRKRFWVVFEAQADGRGVPSDALAGLLETARRGIGSDVEVGPDGSAEPLTARGALTVVALSGIRLVLSPPPRPVRSCDRCGWFFLDTSRGRRRRWCSMKTCGNQAKAARFRSAHP
ncbi:CGNR zinc finger domain-containing protein [Nocardia mexicana]|uniref:Putative RNA-binding Zn ribbon-like protein n=1 Tax=Nocardia mexicana TaxID=279262 RepID=A0A370HDP6_9NOCA|nr:ABATE domain-containing protein [Nocardia mexicana]RDI54611.1 putative RNA-binding Zn ribbon-like protein [Nocardia mexicana]